VKILEVILSHPVLLSLILWTVLMFLWGILLAAWRYVPRVATFIRRSMDEADTASAMRLGFLQTNTTLCLCCLIGVASRFDCAAFWGAVATSFVAAYAAKGWQRQIELRAATAAASSPTAP